MDEELRQLEVRVSSLEQSINDVICALKNVSKLLETNMKLINLCHDKLQLLENSD